jgi:hypothetical protein
VAKSYHLGRGQRLGNLLVKALMPTPFASPHYVMLTMTGCKTGQPRSPSVWQVTAGGQRFLVAPYVRPVTRACFDACADASLDRIVAEAAADPVYPSSTTRRRMSAACMSPCPTLGHGRNG